MSAGLIAGHPSGPSSSPVLNGYHALGSVIASDFALSDLSPRSATDATVVVRERWEELPEPGPQVRVVEDGKGGEPLIQIFEGSNGIHYCARDVGSFWIAASGKSVNYRLATDARPADVEHLIVGPVFGLALQLQGRVLLHASAVAVDGAAVAFAAPHGFGKSTLVASFVRDDYPMLTDDILPLAKEGPQPTVWHSVPRIKLWADSLAALGESEGSYDCVVSWLDKRRVAIGQHWGRMASDELPLRALYLLSPHGDASRPIAIDALAPLPATLRLLSNMYMADMLNGERAQRALAAATRLVDTVPVRSVSYCRSFTTLPELKATILADVRNATRVA